MVTRYTRVAGWIFVTLGVLGLFTSQLLGLIQFDKVHTIIHLILGVLAFAAVANRMQKLFALVMGPLLLLLGAFGLFMPTLMGMHLEAVENFLHLLLGGWGIYATVYKRT